jgi:hypothetical protein
MSSHSQQFADIPNASDDLTPYWNNHWLPPLDAFSLMHFLIETRPRRYIEVGSGMSTIFARHAIGSAGGAYTKITSIDPEPRAGIDSRCDEVVRERLECVDFGVFDQLEAGDILFFDGSHVTFADSDVVVFFLEVLPRLKAGVLVQVHDIFWPYDYPPEWRSRFYSEQYMLAMPILYGKYETVLANAFISRDPDLRSRVERLTSGSSVYGYYGQSYWFRT